MDNDMQTISAMNSTLNIMGEYMPYNQIEDKKVRYYLDKLYYYLSFGNRTPQEKELRLELNELYQKLNLTQRYIVDQEYSLTTNGKNKTKVKGLTNE